jgi:hypothetical protein
MDFFDTFSPGFWGLLIGILITIGRLIYQRIEDKEADTISTETYQYEYKKLLRERKKLKVNEINSLTEDDIWNIVNLIKNKSKNSYKAFTGHLKDHVRFSDREQLLGLYLGFLSILIKANSYRLFGAFHIISNSVNFGSYDNFSSWLMSKGRAAYNNSIYNPDLIRNIEIGELTDQSILGAIIECYEIRHKEFFPEIIDYELPEPSGEEIKMEELPDLFPRLWEKFIVPYDQ